MNHVLGGCAMTEPERDCVRASRETQKVEYRYIQLFVLPLHYSYATSSD
jgi:hypothetical protein